MLVMCHAKGMYVCLMCQAKGCIVLVMCSGGNPCVKCISLIPDPILLSDSDSQSSGSSSRGTV